MRVWVMLQWTKLSTQIITLTLHTSTWITYEAALTPARVGFVSVLRPTEDRDACSWRRSSSRRQFKLENSDITSRDHGLLLVISSAATATPRPTCQMQQTKPTNHTNHQISRKQLKSITSGHWSYNLHQDIRLRHQHQTCLKYCRSLLEWK